MAEGKPPARELKNKRLDRTSKVYGLIHFIKPRHDRRIHQSLLAEISFYTPA